MILVDLTYRKLKIYSLKKYKTEILTRIKHTVIKEFRQGQVLKRDFDLSDNLIISISFLYIFGHKKAAPEQSPSAALIKLFIT